ncbi:P-loop containing nucleoside triphosphate hydrolase protein [Baffinella frigidus]|nr:P-loop containing nucleoside triphosphate hydrolase protein [Cryptophyta sp. CCMP2293]
MLELFLSTAPRAPPPLCDLALLGREAVGLVGRDLRTACAQALGAAVRRAAAGRESGDDAAVNDGGVVCGEDIAAAIRTVSRSSGDGSALKGGAGSFEAIGGMEEVKEALRRAVEWPLLREDQFRAMGVRPSRGVLLYGAPGCGKTTLVRAVAGLAGVAFLHASGAELFSAFLGESERILRSLFARARAARPCVIFLDEIDALVGRRSLDAASQGGGGEVQLRVLSTLLNEMDGVEDAGGVMVVGATNRPDMIDAALLRPGRFDLLLEVGLPDAASRLDILRKASRSMALSPDAKAYLPDLAGQLEGHTGAELHRVCMEAALAALRESIAAPDIARRHLEQALAAVSAASARGDFDAFAAAV